MLPDTRIKNFNPTAPEPKTLVTYGAGHPNLIHWEGGSNGSDVTINESLDSGICTIKFFQNFLPKRP